MARSILVLILAAVPALAQYNANTYNVRPSGGSVGQVCFYETAANGSNKFCITGVSSLSGDGSVSVAALGGNFDYTPTAYDNTTWEQALHVAVNGASSQTIIQGIQGAGQYTADGIAVAHDCPSTATNWECGALSGVITHGSVTTNAVALRGYVVQSASGTGTANNQRVKGWGLNTLFADAGFDYGYGITEFDYNIDGANTKVIGVSVGGNGTGTISGDSAGFVCNTLNVPQWPVCFTALDGTSAVFMSAGTTGTGNNVGSQPIYFYGRNSGGTTQRGSLKVDANGNTIIEAGALASPVEFAILADGTITAKNADFAPSGQAGNYVQTRKLELVDGNGGDLFFDARAFVHATSGQRYMEFRDNAGTPLVQFWRQETGSVAVDYAQWYVDMIPDSDGGQAVGISGRYWGSAAINTITANQLTPKSVGNSDIGGTGSAFGDAYVGTLWNTLFRIDSGGGSDMIFEGNLTPWTNEGHNLGSQSYRWNAVHGRRWESYDGTYSRIVLNSPGAGSNAGSAISVLSASGASMLSLSYAGSLTSVNITATGNLYAYGVVELEDDDASNYVRLQAPATVSSDYTVTMRASDCAAGEYLTLGSSGTMTCSTPSGAGLPVVDTTSIVEGSSDNTKEVRIEADGITTGTVRVWTAPNADITVAGINLAQTWTATQTFGGGSSIDTSGNFNAVSLAIGGNTRINSSSAWSGVNFLPASDGTLDHGSQTARWVSYYAATAYYIWDGTYTRFSASGGSVIGRNSSGTTQWTISTTNGTMEVLNWYIANGTAGQTATKTVRDSAGTGTCTLVFTGGIYTGGTC